MNKLKHFYIILFFIFFPCFLFSNTILIYSDFNDGKVNKNNIGGVAGFLMGNGGNCVITAESSDCHVYGKHGYSLCLNYNINSPDSFAGYWSKLNKFNLSAYNYLSLWVKGSKGNELLKVEIKVAIGDENSKASYIYISDFIAGGVTTDWKKVIIPLDSFINIQDWTEVTELNIVFENTQSAQNESPLKSTVYIDNILFGTAFLEYLTINNHNSQLQFLPIGGNILTGATKGTISYSVNKDYYCSFPYSLQLSYDLSTSGSYIFYSMILGGGLDGLQKVDKNLSIYDKFTFWARAINNNTNPAGLKVEIHDYSGFGEGEPFYIIQKDASGHIQAIWQKISIDLSDFKDKESIRLDKRKIQEIVFTLENSNISNDTGEILIDNIQFETKDYVDNSAATPDAPYGLQDNTGYIENGHTFTYLSRLTVHADSSVSDPLMECICFEYSTDKTNWHIFKTDYDLNDTVYETELNMDNFSEERTYYLRVAAQNLYGNVSVLGPYNSIQIKKVDYKEERPGHLIYYFQVVNNPFSPEDNEQASFQYMLLKQADIVIKVFDIEGNLVWKKEENSKSAEIKHTLKWNGKDKYNNKITKGIYFYKFSAKDVNGEKDKIIQVIGVIK